MILRCINLPRSVGFERMRVCVWGGGVECVYICVCWGDVTSLLLYSNAPGIIIRHLQMEYECYLCFPCGFASRVKLFISATSCISQSTQNVTVRVRTETKQHLCSQLIVALNRVLLISLNHGKFILYFRVMVWMKAELDCKDSREINSTEIAILPSCISHIIHVQIT